jgi:phosphoesterase RecJ-like protein
MDLRENACFISFLTKEDIDKTIDLYLYQVLMTQAPLGFQNHRKYLNEHEIDLGVENTKIPSLLFENSSYSRLQLLGRALQKSQICQHQTAYTTLLRRVA